MKTQSLNQKSIWSIQMNVGGKGFVIEHHLILSNKLKKSIRQLKKLPYVCFSIGRRRTIFFFRTTFKIIDWVERKDRYDLLAETHPFYVDCFGLKKTIVGFIPKGENIIKVGNNGSIPFIRLVEESENFIYGRRCDSFSEIDGKPMFVLVGTITAIRV